MVEAEVVTATATTEDFEVEVVEAEVTVVEAGVAVEVAITEIEVVFEVAKTDDGA